VRSFSFISFPGVAQTTFTQGPSLPRTPTLRTLLIPIRPHLTTTDGRCRLRLSLLLHRATFARNSTLPAPPVLSLLPLPPLPPAVDTAHPHHHLPAALLLPLRQTPLHLLSLATDLLELSQTLSVVHLVDEDGKAAGRTRLPAPRRGARPAPLARKTRGSTTPLPLSDRTAPPLVQRRLSEVPLRSLRTLPTSPPSPPLLQPTSPVLRPSSKSPAPSAPSQVAKHLLFQSPAAQGRTSKSQLPTHPAMSLNA
jgi:hypothetical protein